jgi:TatD DNase family protein
MREPSLAELIELAAHPKVVAIGETGLDYYRLEGRTIADMEWQRERFRTHIRAAHATGKPLIIHTRSSAEDTLRIMAEERASEPGGVMHCFTEPWAVAEQALAQNFYISLSGIVTFKSATDVQDVARRVPLDRLLIEA